MNKWICIGGGVPFAIAAVTLLLFADGMFTNDNSKSLAVIIIVGGALFGLLIFGFWLTRKLDNFAKALGKKRDHPR